MIDLYPLKFKPIYKTKIWGGPRIRKQLNFIDAPDNCGEVWLLSSLPGDVSEVSEGFLAENNLLELIEVYMGDLVGDKVYEKFGDEFPLLFKIIDANQKLSVQVHPEDNLAKERHHSYGKTEMWHILESVPHAQVVTNLKSGTTPEILKQFLSQNRVEDILVSESVSPGDYFFIEAGRVHAIGEGILFAEIQQSSDITYRLYDYNRTDSNGDTRELHVDLALDAINYNLTERAKIRVNSTPNFFNRVVTSPYFTVNQLSFDKPTERDYADLDSFVVYLCIEGECEIGYENGNGTFRLCKGEVILIPAMLTTLYLKPTKTETKLLEVYIEEE